MNQDERRELLAFAQRLLGIDSPSGYTMHAMQFLQEEAEKLGFSCVRSAKGNLIIRVPGTDPYTGLRAERTLRYPGTDGALDQGQRHPGRHDIGAPTLPTLDSAYCRILPVRR